MRTQARRRRGGRGKHDHGYKLLFSHPRTVEALVRGFLQEGWAALLDFSTLERTTGSFVSEDLQERHSDLVWQVRWKGDREGPWLYLLLEFQSSPDPSMPLRLLAYIALLLQALVRTGKAIPAHLPLVLPIVVYNGRPAWRAPLELAGLFAPLAPAARRHLPRLQYVLLDERKHNLDHPELAQNLAAGIFRIETCKTRQDFTRRVPEALCLFSTEDVELRRILTSWLRGKLRRVASGDILGVRWEETAMLEETILRWERELRREGLQEGRREGQLEGMRRMLFRLLELKFGSLPPKIRRSVEAKTRVRDLERLAGRVLKANSLSELRLT